MRSRLSPVLAGVATFVALLVLHLPLLHLPYFWDEAGYYVPAALDFSRAGQLVPSSTLPVGHTPLVMVYLGLVWRVLGYSPLVTRAAIALMAAAVLVVLYKLAREAAGREAALWSALLLALSPLFFAQSTLVHLDLTAALFTTLAVLFLLRGQLWLFAAGASLAILSKETAVVLLPVAWLYTWKAQRRPVAGRWTRRAAAPLVAPLAVAAAWALYYHHATGYWTGNREYLSYNLYGTLSPVRIFWTFLRRAYELFVGGFNWLVVAAAAVGLWWGRKRGPSGSAVVANDTCWRSLVFLAGGLIAVYLLLLSVVGGAVLPRYLLPVFPLFYLVAVAWILRLPRRPARWVLSFVAASFVGAWFINPPCPFPYEDNLSYADFIRLHQQAAGFLEKQPGRPRILTAWPATDELTEPRLGYVARRLEVVPIESFAPGDVAAARDGSFDLLYLYSRKWEPPGNWMTRFPAWLRMQERYFDYRPQASFEDLAARYHLRPVAEFQRRGQWVRIYTH